MCRDVRMGSKTGVCESICVCLLSIFFYLLIYVRRLSVHTLPCGCTHTRPHPYESYIHVFFFVFFFTWSVCDWASECVSGDGRLSRSPPSSPEIFTPVRHDSLHVLSHTCTRHSHWQMASPTRTNTPIPTQKQHIHALFNIFIWCYMKWRVFAYRECFFFLLLMRKNGFKKQTDAQFSHFTSFPLCTFPTYSLSSFVPVSTQFLSTLFTSRSLYLWTLLLIQH